MKNCTANTDYPISHGIAKHKNTIMATVTLFHRTLEFSPMAEKIYTISQNTLIPISLVLSLLGGGIYYESRMVSMAAKIEAVQTANLRLEATIKEVQSTSVGQKEFDLRLKGLEEKLDQLLKLVSKK